MTVALSVSKSADKTNVIETHLFMTNGNAFFGWCKSSSWFEVKNSAGKMTKMKS
jgi:hypothetical protein